MNSIMVGLAILVMFEVVTGFFRTLYDIRKGL